MLVTVLSVAVHLLVLHMPLMAMPVVGNLDLLAQQGLGRLGCGHCAPVLPLYVQLGHHALGVLAKQNLNRHLKGWAERQSLIGTMNIAL